MNITICICTRRRQEGLLKLLNSLEKLVIPPGAQVRIVIVENDSENFSEERIKEFSSGSKFTISYYLEKRQGIVFARNRSVKESGDCDFCCFTDDDQVVSVNWLEELLKCQLEFDADGVAGPTRPLFGKKVPSYIEKYHQPDSYAYGTIVESAYTGCLLLSKKRLDLLDGPFDIRLNFSGGEDSYLTRQVTNLGGIIRFNPDAIAYEIIPDNRSTVRYVIKRTYRTSNTRLYINSINDKKFRKINALPRLVMRLCNGFLLILPYIVFGKTDRLKGLIKIVNAFGGFAYIFGKQSQFYK